MLHGSSSPSRESLRRQITLLRQLERQANLVIIHGRESLPFVMDASRLKRELKVRRLSDHGERQALEERLEHALMKEDCAKTFMPDDGYAYGRVEVDVDEYLEPKTNKELAGMLRTEHGVAKVEMPKKKGGKVELLKEMLGERLHRQIEEALLTALQCRLHHLAVVPCSKGGKRALFAQLDAELAKAET